MLPLCSAGALEEGVGNGLTRPVHVCAQPGGEAEGCGHGVPSVCQPGVLQMPSLAKSDTWLTEGESPHSPPG